MKRMLSIVATLGLLVGTSVAQAADNAWFHLQGSSDPGSIVGSASGAGLPLNVTTDTAGPITLNIGFSLTNDTYGTPMAGLGLHLGPVPGGTYSPTTVTSANYNAAVVNTGGNELNAIWLSNPPTGPTGHVINFSLTLGALAPGQVINIFGDQGAGDTATSQGYAWYGRVANNEVIYGYGGTSWGNLPVITITNIPEPTSVVLLALGAVALIRRRK
jgi:hypothetical protein